MEKQNIGTRVPWKNIIWILSNKIKNYGNKSNDDNETGSRSPCMRPRSDPPKMKNSTQTTLLHFNFSVTAELKDVTRRLIILINEEINEANWMVSNSAKLDRRTKQHTQFGVSVSHGSRDMVRTKAWRKKKEKKIEREQNLIASPTGIANNSNSGNDSSRDEWYGNDNDGNNDDNWFLLVV